MNISITSAAQFILELTSNDMFMHHMAFTYYGVSLMFVIFSYADRNHLWQFDLMTCT